MTIQEVGDESVTLTLDAGESLVAGNGNNLIHTSNLGGNVLLLGNGNNQISGGADRSVIALGNGNNTVNVIFGELRDLQLSFGQGDNTVTLFTASAVNADIRFGGGRNALTVLTALSDGRISFGDGGNAASLTGTSAVSNEQILFGRGDDSLFVTAALRDSRIAFGEGVNSVRLSGILNPLPHSNDVLLFGDGADKLDIDGNLANDFFDLGNGKNAVRLFGLSATDSFVLFGNGDDSLSISSLSLSGFGAQLGDGNNLVSLNAAKAAVSIVAGAGNDTLRAANADLAGSVFAFGEGNDFISLSATTGAAAISSGDGDDGLLVQFATLGGSVFELGAGSDAVLLNQTTGDATIKAGSGSDTIRLVDIASGDIRIERPFGAGPSVFDLRGASITGALTITNSADVVFGAPAGMKIEVAVDGFQLPVSAKTSYVATGEAIAAPYDIAEPLPYFISSLLFDPPSHWTQTIGRHDSAPVFGFSIMQSLPTYATGFDAFGFATIGSDLPPSVLGRGPQDILAANSSHTISLTPVELSVVTALANWQTVANVRFVGMADSDSVPFRFGSNNQGLSSAGYSFVPIVPQNYFSGVAQRNGETADVYLSNFNNGLDYRPHGFGSLATLHEIGHGLGIGGDCGASDPRDVIPFGEDTLSYSVMTHNNAPINGAFPNSPQVFDIATIQYLYGPNPSYHPNSAHLWSFNRAGGTENLIFDGSGFSDSISAGFTAENAFIDLRPGHWSHLGPQRASILAPNQLFVGYGTQIQVGMGGFGSDTIVGNEGAHSLFGGGGDDLLILGPGNATLDGGSGVNTVAFADARAAYDIALRDGSFVVTELLPNRQGQAVLSNVQKLQFSDALVTLGEPTPEAPALLGGSGDDLLIGRGAADTLLGGAGNDSIAIGDGNDLVLAGELGSGMASGDADTIAAGHGNNTLIGGSGAGVITVGDGNNLIALHAPGLTAYGNTVLRLGSGSDTVLAVGGSNTIFGGAGLDLVDGGNGSASILGGSGPAVIWGGGDASTITAGSGPTMIFGRSGGDSILGGTGGDTITAAGGDTVRAGAGKDFINLDPGSATVFTTLGRAAVTIDVGRFSGDNQQKSITLGAGAATLIFDDPNGAIFAPSSLIKIAGYKPGIDHFLLHGLGEHALGALGIEAVGSDSRISVGDVGVILLVGVPVTRIDLADFLFQ